MNDESQLLLLERLKLKNPTVSAETFVATLSGLIDEHTQQQEEITNYKNRIEYLDSVIRSLRGITQELSKLI